MNYKILTCDKFLKLHNWILPFEINIILPLILENVNFPTKLESPLHYGSKSVYVIHCQKFDISNNKIINEKIKSFKNFLSIPLFMILCENLITSDNIIVKEVEIEPMTLFDSNYAIKCRSDSNPTKIHPVHNLRGTTAVSFICAEILLAMTNKPIFSP